MMTAPLRPSTPVMVRRPNDDGVSPALDAPGCVLLLDARCECAFVVRPCHDASEIRATLFERSTPSAAGERLGSWFRTAGGQAPAANLRLNTRIGLPNRRHQHA